MSLRVCSVLMVVDLGVPFDNEFDSIYVDKFEVRSTGLGKGESFPWIEF